MSAPPADRGQLEFLQHVQRIFDEGEFVATYKFALLIALVELAIERGDDTGAPLELDLHAIAEKFIEQYWPHAAPYSAADGAPAVLVQNHGRKAAIVAQNFVLAHGACNLDKGDLLGAPAHLAHWVQRNRELGADPDWRKPSGPPVAGGVPRRSPRGAAGGALGLRPGRGRVGAALGGLEVHGRGGSAVSGDAGRLSDVNRIGHRTRSARYARCGWPVGDTRGLVGSVLISVPASSSAIRTS